MKINQKINYPKKLVAAAVTIVLLLIVVVVCLVQIRDLEDKNDNLYSEIYNLRGEIEHAVSEMEECESERKAAVLENLKMRQMEIQSRRLENQSNQGFNSSIYARKLGTVVLIEDDCDMIVFQTGNGYVLAELYSGYTSTGAVFAGDLTSYGTKTLVDLNGSNEIRVYIEDYMLSRASVLNKLREECDE